MRAQPAQSSLWRCIYCDSEVPSGYAHKCLQFDKAITFFEGAPVPPLPEPQIISDIADKTKWTGGPLNQHDRHWVMIGARHGFVSGWHAGFAIASAMSAGTAETPSEAQGEARQRGAEGRRPTFIENQS